MTAKKTSVSRKRRKILWMFLGLLLVIGLVFSISQPTIKSLVDAFRVGKLNNQTTLPPNIQKAIQNEAVKELTQGANYQHTDVLSQVDNEDTQAAEARILPNNPLYLFKKASRRAQEFFTFNPLAKTQLILKHNSSEMIETLTMLQKGGSADIAASQISEVEGRFNQVLSLTDKDKAISALAFNYAEKYFRQELILQGLEEKLDDSSIIKIETARAKGLQAYGKLLIQYHPDPQILARELANSLSPLAGASYKELKTAQILQELEDAMPNEVQKLPLRMSQYILIERFEKKVLAMPFAKRQALLDIFVGNIPGNPMREFKTFTRIRKVFKSPQLIIYAELYKAKILEHFEKRVLGLSTSNLQNEFVSNWISDPEDLRILEALELRAGTQPKMAEIIKNLKSLSKAQIAKLYENNPEKLKESIFYKSATTYPDVLDIKVAVDLGNKNLEKQVVHQFISNLPVGFSGIAVNATAETMNLLDEISSDFPLSIQNEIIAAIEAETILDSIEVPETASLINNLVNELEQNQNVAIIIQNLQIPIDEIIEIADTETQGPTLEEIVQRTEQLTEEIFSSPADQETPIEEVLPPTIQQEIQQIETTTNSIPQVDQTLIQTVVNTVQQPAPAVIETPPPVTTTVPVL